MWLVKGKTIGGKDVEYKVTAGRDTDKAYVMALAFQDHGKASPDDALTMECVVSWTSDNVFKLVAPIALSHRVNYIIEKRKGKGEWQRFSKRAYRANDSATEALESAASQYPNDVFRIVAITESSEVVKVSKNGVETVGEKAEEPADAKKETGGVQKATTPKAKAA